MAKKIGHLLLTAMIYLVMVLMIIIFSGDGAVFIYEAF